MKLALDDKLKGSRQLRILMALLASEFDNLDIDDLDNILNSEDTAGAKDPVDLVADYLSKVRETTYMEMRKRYGDAMFATMRRELVVTVPAVWSERAKDLTTRAVSRAKWDAAKLSLVTEPEAAAIYTLRGMREGVTKEDIQVSSTHSWFLVGFH